LKAGVLRLLVHKDGSSMVPMGDELMPAVRCAFNASRNLEKDGKKDGVKKKVSKGKKAKVGLTEFRPFLIAFKYYLQLLELFEFMDGQADDNQKLSLREIKRAVLLIADWGITEEELDEKFKGVDPWVSHMSFKDFANWCIDEKGCLDNLEEDVSDNEDVMRATETHLVQKESGIEFKSDGAHGVVARDSEENNDTVQELFAQWDTDGSGSITEEELGKVLMKLDKTMTQEKVAKLFAAADHNKDGTLDSAEFIKWLLS